MTEMAFRKHHVGGWLVPMDAAAEEWLTKTKPGQDVLVTARRPRNVQHHRKFFALMNVVLENQLHYESLEHLIAAAKVAVGHCVSYPMKDGNTAFVPHSMNFASMGQEEFEPFYSKVMDWVCAKVIPGMVPAELQREVLERISGSGT